ncbi:SNO glutamine amidotransferase [Dendrothele bispora CBS 962.96]|uniref:glutaminase n=1 Tax=Dendrothele bispora (strain CBS 962.96) TaxID=1314807 RepID=A0A4S8KY70_DENBC|nr:SNO glutamine amidotransferase [Dendrothele bispora CBS 962.96]
MVYTVVIVYDSHPALQGAFAEHQKSQERLESNGEVKVVQVRTKEDLDKCDALVIPGGESTTIALLARLSGLLDPLKEFIKAKPVWGTCAGAILLSKVVTGAKKGGQELLGGMSVTIARNGWGSQVESFEAPLEVPGLKNPEDPFSGVFIRAPVLLSLDQPPEYPPIQVIARLPENVVPHAIPSDATEPLETWFGINSNLEGGGEDPKRVVAIRQGRHLLTTFHPELTRDNRFHEYFVRECVIPGLLST